MWKIFKRRRTSQPEAPPLPPCAHTWKDFPWYVKGVYTNTYGNTYGEFYIYEPYVCAHCKERKDVILLHSTKAHISESRYNEILAELKKQYKDHIQPTPIIEDMINDFIYVDQEKLDILGKLRNANAEKIKL